MDQQGGARTALAILNPSEDAVTATLILRDPSGDQVDQKEQMFAAGQHQSLFVDQLFSGLENFTGSLTFQTQQEGERLAAVTLRQNTNLQGEPIFATLPVVDLTGAATKESIFFPQVGAGAGLSTQLVLMNPSGSQVAGRIQLFNDDGFPLEMELEGMTGTSFAYQIDPNGTFQGELTSGAGTNVGYAVVTLDEGSQSPAGSAIFQFTSGVSVISEAGVAASRPTRLARVFVDNVGTRTGVAVANPQSNATTVTFELLDGNGAFLQRTSQDLPGRGHFAKFADELFPGLADDFKGLMEISTPTQEVFGSIIQHPVAIAVLKLTTNQRSLPVLATLPIADLSQTVTAASLIFPQIGFGDFDGGSFSTQLILINPDPSRGSGGQLRFFQPSGDPLLVPLGAETDSEFPYLIPAGGGTVIRPGVPMGPIAEIVLDPANPDEVIVNEARRCSFPLWFLTEPETPSSMST